MDTDRGSDFCTSVCSVRGDQQPPGPAAPLHRLRHRPPGPAPADEVRLLAEDFVAHLDAAQQVVEVARRVRVVGGGVEGERVLDFRERGAEFVWVRLYTPGMEPEVALEMTSRFGEEVIPLVRRETGETEFFARAGARAA